MGWYKNYKRKNLLKELRGLQDESTLVKNSEHPDRNNLLRETQEIIETTVKELESLGIPTTPIDVDGQTTYEPMIPPDSKQLRKQWEEILHGKTEKKSKRRKILTYIGAGLMIGAVTLGAYSGYVGFENWKELGTHKEPALNETPINRRDGNNNTTENPIIESPEQPTIPQNPTPQQNHTEINETPINQTPPVIDTPDYLKSASGIFTGDTFVGRYEIADKEHNPNGNYSMKLRDGNRTILETDLEDSEGGHSFQFGTEDLDVEKEYSVELLRNGTKAYEPFKFTIKNSPPSVSLEASAKLGIDNKSRIIEYSARMSDDRGLAEANFYLYDDNGNLVQQIRKEELKGRGMLFNGLHIVDGNQKAGKHHVVAKVYDRDRAEKIASDDVDIPEIPIQPPPPPPPPPDNNGTINKTHFPPQITSAKMYIDKDTGKAISDLTIDDPDSDVFYLDQKFSDNQTGENLIGNVSNRTTMNGKNVHSEVDMNGGNPDGIYNWELGVSDGENRTKTTFTKVWNWMRDLLGYWKFDNNGTDFIKGNNASLQNGAGFTQGKKNQALSLDGINDYAEIPNSPNYNPDTFSITLRFNENQLEDYATLFNNGGNGGFAIMNDVNLVGKHRIQILGNGNLLGVTPNIDANTLYFLSFTYNKTTGEAKTSLGDDIGNLQVVDDRIVLGGAGLGSAPVYIGTPYADGTKYLGGWLDDLRFYGRALSERIIKAIYDDI